MYPLTSGSALFVADENGDAARDLLLVDGATVTALRGGALGFTQAWSVTGYGTMLQPALFDVDGDGAKDLLFTQARSSGSTWSYELRWARRTGAASFAADQWLASGIAWFGLADLNNDGRTDVAGVTIIDNDWTRDSRFSALINQGGGLFRSLGTLTGPSTFISQAEVADLNEDGHVDLLFRTNTAIGWATGDGRGGFSSYALLGTPGWPMRFAVTDLDRDGHVDLVLNATSGGYGTWLMRGLGTGAFESRGFAVPSGLVDYGPVVADFDGVGLADVVVASFDHFLLLRGRCP